MIPDMSVTTYFIAVVVISGVAVLGALTVYFKFSNRS